MTAVLAALAPMACGRKSSLPSGGVSGPRYALLAGASGEASEPNFFLDDLSALRTRLIARGWQVRAVVGSKDGLLPGSLKASNANLLQGVKQTLKAAHVGDQALLLFHSHGRESEKSWGQRSHSIVSEDRDETGNDPGFDLDVIEPEMKEAQARGVKVAFVDLSCYSGSSQALKGAACTVSLAASRYVSLCSGREEERGFNSRFFKLPEASVPVTLEAQYLESRRFDHDSINLARISSLETPALEGWEKFLVAADPLDTFEDLKNLKTGTKAFDPRELLSRVDAWIAKLPREQKTEAHSVREEIAERLAHALSLRKALEASMPALAKDYDAGDIKFELPGREPASLVPAYLFELLDAAQTGKTPDGYTDAQSNLLKAVKPKEAELSRKYAGPLSAFRVRREAFDQMTDEFARAADELFEAERALYELRAAPVGADPCRDFAL